MGSRRAWSLLIAAGTAVALTAPLALPAAPAAEAAGPVDYFKDQGCGVRYRAEVVSTYSNAKKKSLNKALNSWRFDDVKGKQIKPPANWRKLAKSKADRSKLHSLKFLDRLYSIADERRLPTTQPYSAAAERKALANAVAIAADWSRAAARGKVGSDAWKQRIAGIRAPYLVYGARKAACEGTLKADHAAAIKPMVRRHAKVLAKSPSKFTPQNHKFSINTGLAALGAYFPADGGVRKLADKAGARFVATISKGYNAKEGTWLEQSPRYQLLSYRLLQNFLDRIDPGSRPVKKVATNLLSTLGRFLQPNNRLVTWGDTSGEEFSDGDLIGAKKTGWWVAFGSGTAIYSSPESWFGAAAQYHTRQHKQADELTFDLYEDGQYLIRDSGFFHKDNSQWGRFQALSRAHSVLTVDDRDFDWKLHQNPYGSGLQAATATGDPAANDGWYALRGENPLLIAPTKLTKAQRSHSKKFQQKVRAQHKKAARFNARHTRTFVYKPGDALIVADAVRSDREHDYRRYFHFGAGTTVAETGPDALSLSAGQLRGTVLSSSSVDPIETTLLNGWLDPTLGWEFPEAENRVSRFTAVLKTRAQDLDQVTAILYGPDAGRYDSIRAVGALDGDHTLEILDAKGSVIRSLRISRDKRSMSVAES